MQLSLSEQTPEDARWMAMVQSDPISRFSNISGWAFRSLDSRGRRGEGENKIKHKKNKEVGPNL